MEKEIQMKVKVFIYGSLKRGFHNNSVLGIESKFIKECALEMFDMYDLGTFPCIIPNTKCEVHTVQGELWEVPLDVLCFQLDRLERYNPYRLDNMYNRVIVETNTGERCFTYVWNGEFEDKYEKIESGVWENPYKTDYFKI